MADAGPGTDSRKSSVGEYSHFTAPRYELQRRSNLIGLLHAGTKRPAARQYQDIARLNGVIYLSFHCGNCGALAGKDTRPSRDAIHAIVVHHRRINRGRLDDRTLGAKIAHRKTDCTGHTLLAGLIGLQNHRIRVNPILLLQEVA